MGFATFYPSYALLPATGAFAMSDVPQKPTTRLADIIPPKKFLTPTQRERARTKVFRPLAIELGWLVYEWNRLQEALAELFATIVTPNNVRVGFAIWHELTNERAQRDILRAAIDARQLLETPKPRAYDDIAWILKQLDALAGRRNDAVHAPLVFINSFGAEEQIEILPMHFFGNPRAKQLKDKSLLEEFRWYRDHLARLAEFAENLQFGIKFPVDYTWPDRPQLPSRGHFASRAPQRRKSRSK
jgi:hypothetical protein